MESIVLSKVLDSLELSETHVKSKVSMFSRLEVLANAVDFQPDYQNTILTGSIMDGVGWKGYMTDIDTMLRFSYVTVVENGSDQPFNEKHHLFKLEDDKTHPGYTRLMLQREGILMENNIFSLTPYGAKSYCFEEDGKHFLSSYKFKTAFNRYQLIPERPAWVMQSSYNYAVNFPDDDEILEHGPSLCFTDETKEEPSHDSVPCFHCPTWPKQAEEWITRMPRHWPDKEVVKRMVKMGCDVVPVGFLKSKTRYLEWRLSFALTEKELLRTFNNTQHKCYALLKMLLKEVIQEKLPGVLSSFQVKNALFWTMEREEVTLWTDERIAEAFMKCVETLNDFVKNGVAPSYFIRSNNVLEDRVLPTDLQELKVLFSEIMTQGWAILLKCKSLTAEPEVKTLLEKCVKNDDIDENMLLAIDRPDTDSILLNHDQMLFPRFEDARLEIFALMIQTNESLPLTIVRHHEMLQRIEDRCVNAFYRKTLEPIVAAIKSSLGYHLFCHDAVLTDNNLGSSLQEAEKYLSQGMMSDAAAGKLKYATFLYMSGRIPECITITSEITQNHHALTFYNPHFLPSKFGPTQVDYQKYRSFVENREMSLDQRYMSSVFHAVLFLPSEVHVVPEAVKFQLQSSLQEPLDYTTWLSWAIYDPLVFAHYLTFLCKKHNKNDDAEESLRAIENLLAEKNVGYESSALNLLGFTYISMNQVERGIPFLLRAMENNIAPHSTLWSMGTFIADMLQTPPSKFGSKYASKSKM